MRDTYKGESPSKKFMRVQYWMTLIEKLGGLEAFRRKKHLVLASREAGDVSLLLAFGVPPANIVAVDHSLAAIKGAQKKFPEVEFVHGDVLDVAKTHEGKVATAFLDYCAPIKPPLIHKTMEVMQTIVQKDGWLGAAFMVSREKTVTQRPIPMLRAAKNSVDKVLSFLEKSAGWSTHVEFFKVLQTLTFLPAYSGVGGLDVKYKISELRRYEACLSRYLFLEQLLLWNVDIPQFLVGQKVLLYHSITGNRGTPMVVFLGKVTGRSGLEPVHSKFPFPELRLLRTSSADVKKLQIELAKEFGEETSLGMLNMSKSKTIPGIRRVRRVSS